MTFGLGLSPLGTYGLGAGSGFGDYSSFMPSAMGMYGMGSMYGLGGFGGMGNIFDYQRYMQQMQQQMELNSLNHTAAMHSGMINNEVLAHDDTFSGIIRKLMTDGDIQQRINTLYDKVKEGDQDGVCEEYDKLKNRIYTECSREFKEKGTYGNRADLANQIIESLYGNIINATATDGQRHSLEEDIKRYGDGAFQNGFMTGFRRDHHGRYVDETLNHIYGKRIDHRSEKDTRKTLGTGIGRAANGVEGMITGGALGAASMILGTSVISGLTLPFKKSSVSLGESLAGRTFKFGIKKCGWGAFIGALAGLGYNIYRQCNERNQVVAT